MANRLSPSVTLTHLRGCQTAEKHKSATIESILHRNRIRGEGRRKKMSGGKLTNTILSKSFSSIYLTISGVNIHTLQRNIEGFVNTPRFVNESKFCEPFCHLFVILGECETKCIELYLTVSREIFAIIHDITHSTNFMGITELTVFHCVEFLLAFSFLRTFEYLFTIFANVRRN